MFSRIRVRRGLNLRMGRCRTIESLRGLHEYCLLRRICRLSWRNTWRRLPRVLERRSYMPFGMKKRKTKDYIHWSSRGFYLLLGDLSTLINTRLKERFPGREFRVIFNMRTERCDIWL